LPGTVFVSNATYAHLPLDCHPEHSEVFLHQVRDLN
jgi:hypothetical protein